MYAFHIISVALICMTTASALPRFPFAALFEREPQYEPASNFPTLIVASATGIVPSGNPTGSGSIGFHPTGTGTGSPFFPNSTAIGSTGGVFPEPTGDPLSSFSIATSAALGSIKAPLTGATALVMTSIPPDITGVAASCPVATPVTVTETVTETVSQCGAPYPSGTGMATGTVGSVLAPRSTPFAL